MPQLSLEQSGLANSPESPAIATNHLESPKEFFLQLVIDNTRGSTINTVTVNDGDNAFTLGSLNGFDRLEGMANYMVAALGEGRSPALLQELVRAHLGKIL